MTMKSETEKGSAGASRRLPGTEVQQFTRPARDSIHRSVSLAAAIVILVSTLGCFQRPTGPRIETPAATATRMPIVKPPAPQVQSPTQDPSTAAENQTAGPSTLFLPFIGNGGGTPTAGQDWPMVGANVERTSWTPEEVSGDLKVEWYRPIEAYISQNTQIIAANGLLYISTARGLYALSAADGSVAWQFDTEIPLGNSPTVANGVVYVGGYDRKLHALDAMSGTHLWSFDGAQAGYATNPLVAEGKVFAGNRDGNMYAIGAQGTPQQGQLIWKFQTGGPVHLSAAYKDGAVYFASNDNYAYALRADSGILQWKSAKMPGDGYQSYWPVIYKDKVIFSGSVAYRHNLYLGTNTLTDGDGNPYDTYDRLQRDDLFFDRSAGGTIGTVSPSLDSWAGGKDVVDASRIREYLEAGPSDAHLHKPWRRVLIVLNRTDGKEYTFDSDQDGHPEYAPVAWWGTRSGNRYPPLVGPDGILYLNNIYSARSKWEIPQGRIMGWNMGTSNFSLIGGQGALDEPQAISAGGSFIYRSICCDRFADYMSLTSDDDGGLWSYGRLDQSAPGYDEMWWGTDYNSDFPGLEGNYGTKNGIYQNHGDQNPLIPYQGRLYIHRRNAILAFGKAQGPGKLPLLKTRPVEDPISPPSLEALKGRLEAEIGKMIASGLLRPGYINGGQFSQQRNFVNYFENPGDTLYTLARAYPYLSPPLKEQTRAYLKNVFQTYFVEDMYARTGWADGAAREAMPLPPEIASEMAGSEKSTNAGEGWTWGYPQHNYYAIWKYAQLFPEDAPKAYEQAKSRLQMPISEDATDGYLQTYPWANNAYIAGYLGFLNLQELAGKSGSDAGLRSQVSNELNRLIALRSNTFSKDTPWIRSDELPSTGGEYHNRVLNISRNFIFLVPELGDTLNKNALAKVQEAIIEYNNTAPYWFVSRYNGAVDEGAIQNLYDYYALFQAKAYILKEPREQLTKYLDVFAFERGDLFYIQNLIAAIEAGPH